VKQVIVVCDPSYKDVFEDAKGNYQEELKFALSVKETQVSFNNFYQAVDPSFELVCIHYSVRPFVLSRNVRKVLTDSPHKKGYYFERPFV